MQYNMFYMFIFGSLKSPCSRVVLPTQLVLNLYVNILLNNRLGTKRALTRKEERQNQEAGKFKASNS